MQVLQNCLLIYKLFTVCLINTFVRYKLFECSPDPVVRRDQPGRVQEQRADVLPELVAQQQLPVHAWRAGVPPAVGLAQILVYVGFCL